jgi:RimJ/RimL family protein N-acetyltransferase
LFKAASTGGLALEVAKYEAIETLPDGRSFRVRALRPDDRAGLLSAVSQSSAQSLHRRFFSQRSFTENEVAYFMDVDFVGHVALVAELEEHGRSVIIGGGRYILIEAGKAEMAFVVVDQYQGQGVGTALMRHLVAIACQAGLNELTAEVLADNVSMLKVFRKTGLPLRVARDAGVVHVDLRLHCFQCNSPT